MRIVTVVGNRPQFVKAAAVSRLLRQQADELIVHTGQHYDDELSRVFFEELSVPAPDRELDAGGGTNTAQTARILGALEPVLEELEPVAGARLWRHQLHAGGRAGGVAGGDPDGARGGRDALVRPRPCPRS